jgi:hypothetical protein
MPQSMKTWPETFPKVRLIGEFSFGLQSKMQSTVGEPVVRLRFHGLPLPSCCDLDGRTYQMSAAYYEPADSTFMPAFNVNRQ